MPAVDVLGAHNPGLVDQIHPPQKNVATNVMRGFNPYLHGARGLFAFFIVVFHVVNSRLPTFPLLSSSWPLFLMRSTEHGVELFFGISGIVIVGALSRARGPGIFAIERATRIFPVLWVTILVIVGLSAFTSFQGREVPSLPVLAENLLAFPPLLPGPLIHPAAWSLSYELTFYGFCALAWVFRGRLGMWAALLVIPAATVLLAWHIRAFLMPFGMLVAVMLARNPAWSKYATSPGLWLLAFLVAWEWVCQLNGGDLIDVKAFQLLHGLTPAFVVVAMVAGTMMFAGVLCGKGVLSHVLRSPSLQFLGTVSYSLYLWHPIIMSIIKHFMYVGHIPEHVGAYSQLIFFILVFPPSLAVAWVSQRYLEKRVTVWLRRYLERGLPGHPTALPPQTTTHL